MGQGHGPMGDPRIHVVPEGASMAGHPDGPSTSTVQESPASPSSPVSPRPGHSGQPVSPVRGLFPDSPPAKRARYEDVSSVEQESSNSHLEPDDDEESVEEVDNDLEGDDGLDAMEVLEADEDLEEDEEDALLGFDAFLDVSSSDSFVVISDPELDLMED